MPRFKSRCFRQTFSIHRSSLGNDESDTARVLAQPIARNQQFCRTLLVGVLALRRRRPRSVPILAAPAKLPFLILQAFRSPVAALYDRGKQRALIQRASNKKERSQSVLYADRPAARTSAAVTQVARRDRSTPPRGSPYGRHTRRCRASHRPAAVRIEPAAAAS